MARNPRFVTRKLHTRSRQCRSTYIQNSTRFFLNLKQLKWNFEVWGGSSTRPKSRRAATHNRLTWERFTTCQRVIDTSAGTGSRQASCHTHTHTHTHINISWRWYLWSFAEDDHKSQFYEWPRWTLQTAGRVAVTFKKTPGFRLPECVDWFASWGQWKPLAVMVRLVSVCKSLRSLTSRQVEIWQRFLPFQTFKEFSCLFSFSGFFHTWKCARVYLNSVMS